MVKYFLSIMLLCGIFGLYGCIKVEEPLVDLGGYESAVRAGAAEEYDVSASDDGESVNRRLRNELARKDRKIDKLKKELDQCEDEIDRLEDRIDDLEDDD